eukprot:11232024-Karenia_brevis.AAC.1
MQSDLLGEKGGHWQRGSPLLDGVSHASPALADAIADVAIALVCELVKAGHASPGLSDAIAETAKTRLKVKLLFGEAKRHACKHALLHVIKVQAAILPATHAMPGDMPRLALED